MFIRLDEAPGRSAVLVVMATDSHVTVAIDEHGSGQHEVRLHRGGGEIERLLDLLSREQSPCEGLVTVLHDAHGVELAVHRDAPGDLLLSVGHPVTGTDSATWVSTPGDGVLDALASYLGQATTGAEQEVA